MTRKLGVGYGTLRRLMEREIDEEALDFVQHEDERYTPALTSIALGIRRWYTL